MKTAKLFLIVVSLVMAAACGSGGISTVGNPNGTEDGFDMASGKYAFYSAANDTIPVIAESAEGSISPMNVSMKVTTGWNSGNPAYEIFNLLREYDNDVHSGVLDMSNLYRVLWEAGAQYTSAVEAVEEITEQAIASPFDFGTVDQTYTHASSNAALRRDDDGTIHALLSWVWDQSGAEQNAQIGYGVLQGSFNDTTGALEWNMVELVDYTEGGDYCLRTYVTGNSLAHTFTLKAGKYNAGEGAYAVSILGTGVAESREEDDYFLMKMLDNDNLSESDGKYYRIDANPTEADIRALSHLGYDIDELVDSEDYASTLDVMTPYALDGSDHATSVDDFSNSRLILSYEE